MDTSGSCVNITGTTVITTLVLSLPINNLDTVLSRQSIECSNEFTIQSEVDLANGNTLTGGLKADLAIMQLRHLGQWVFCFTKLNIFQR